ncbi:unnamed protein product, partial [Closterium sp. NIES-53]
GSFHRSSTSIPPSPATHPLGSSKGPLCTRTCCSWALHLLLHVPAHLLQLGVAPCLFDVCCTCECLFDVCCTCECLFDVCCTCECLFDVCCPLPL